MLDTRCDELTEKTYWYKFFGCPFNTTEYKIGYTVIIPDLIIMMEVLLIISIIYMIDKKIKHMLEPMN